MNEEIKKKRETYIRVTKNNGVKVYFTKQEAELIEMLISQVEKDSYLQGAKDMREAVKIEEEQPDLTGNLTISDIANITGYSRGFSGAVRATNIKAQQFIDSLEKGEKNE